MPGSSLLLAGQQGQASVTCVPLYGGSPTLLLPYRSLWDFVQGHWDISLSQMPKVDVTCTVANLSVLRVNG